jgi:hypothetical protein
MPAEANRDRSRDLAGRHFDGIAAYRGTRRYETLVRTRHFKSSRRIAITGDKPVNGAVEMNDDRGTIELRAAENRARCGHGFLPIG